MSNNINGKLIGPSRAPNLRQSSRASRPEDLATKAEAAQASEVREAKCLVEEVTDFPDVVVVVTGGVIRMPLLYSVESTTTQLGIDTLSAKCSRIDHKKCLNFGAIFYNII